MSRFWLLKSERGVKTMYYARTENNKSNKKEKEKRSGSFSERVRHR